MRRIFSQKTHGVHTSSNVHMRPNWKTRFWKTATPLVAGFIGLAVLTFVTFQIGFELASAGFAYLILIALLSLTGNYIGSIVLSIAAVACLNFFFTPPLFSLRVDYPQDVVALAAFLITSIAIAGLTARVRKIAEERQASQKALIDTIPALVWSAGPDGLRDFHNQNWLQFTGLSAEEAAGEGWAAVLHPDDRTLIVNKWRSALTSGEPFEAEGRARDANDEYRAFIARAVPLRNESGTIVKWYGTSISIEDRKQAEEALRESETHWREVFEHSPVMYFMVDSRGIVQSVNAFGAAQLGYSISELAGQSVLKVFFEEDQEAARRQLAECVETRGREKNWEIRKRHKDGTVLWVRENAKAVQRPGGDVIVLIACADITARKRSEQRLTAQCAIARVLAESGTLAVAAPHLLQAIGGNFEWDWGALWSLDRQSALLRCDYTWSAPTVQTAEFEAISRESALPSGQSWSGKVWRSGLPAWMADAATEPDFMRAPAAARANLSSAVAFPILVGGEVLGVVEFFSRAARRRDEEQIATLLAIGSQIGQFIMRKRAEEALQESEKRFRALVERGYDAVLLSNADGKIIYANPAVTRVLGYSPEELVGRYGFDLADGSQRQESLGRSTLLLEQADHVQIGDARQLRHKDGSWKWIESVAVNRLHEPGVNAVVVNIRDITERKQAEEALRESRAELARVARVTALGELIASIAHEINQPLTAVVTTASAGLRWLAGPSPNLTEAQQAFARIVRDGKRAADVIGRIRALAVKSPVRIDQVNINELILEVIALTRSEMDRNRIALVTQLANDLPPALGDRVQLQQVVLNLIMNGIEAMSDSEARELLIESKRDESQKVLISVCDSGPGLDPRNTDRIFDAFYTTKPGGMGIGLSICRSIIEAHGGRLTASPNSQRGAAFEFALPAASLESQAATGHSMRHSSP